MKRRVYNIAVAISLVLFVVVTGLWVASGLYAARFRLEDTSGRGVVFVTHRHGYASISWIPVKPIAVYRLHPKGFGLTRTQRFGLVPPTEITDDLRFGLRYRREIHLRTVLLAHWLLAIPTLILPVVWLIRRRRNHDPDAVLCAKCGYDLRGSPGGACPECGEGMS